MRGDSVRDLYAKTLALLGLGVLAGTGALVDYWPVDLRTPAVHTPFVSAPLPGPLAVTTLNEPALSQSAADRPQAATPQARPPVRTVGEFAPAAVSARARGDRQGSSLPTLMIATAASLPLGVGVRLREPVPAIHPVPVLSAEGFKPDGAPLIIATNAEPPAGVPRARLAPTQPAPAAGSGDEGDGLITGAFKKAGSSIVKTGARTGTSIFDSFRVVSSMFRRVLPRD